MPDIQPNDTEKTWIPRCIAVTLKENPKMKQDQAVAICYSKWREHQKKKNTKSTENK